MLVLPDRLVNWVETPARLVPCGSGALKVCQLHHRGFCRSVQTGFSFSGMCYMAGPRGLCCLRSQAAMP